MAKKSTTTAPQPAPAPLTPEQERRDAIQLNRKIAAYKTQHINCAFTNIVKTLLETAHRIEQAMLLPPTATDTMAMRVANTARYLGSQHGEAMAEISQAVRALEEYAQAEAKLAAYREMCPELFEQEQAAAQEVSEHD